MFNSLVVKVDGDTFVFECHSYSKAVEILAAHWNLWNESGRPKVSIDSFELV